MKNKIRFSRWLYRVNIYFLVLVPLLLFVFLLSGFLFIGGKIYGNNIPESYYAFTGAFCAIVGSFSGIFQVVRKEGPGPFGKPIYGIWPVISGFVLIAIYWVIALIAIIYGLYYR